MDTKRRIASRFTATSLSIVACVFLLGAWAQPSAAGTHIVIHGGDAAQARSVEWAVGRYRAAGLQGMPELDVYLHTPREACGGYLGTFEQGRIDLCTGESSELYARKFALHELGHAWVKANLSDATRERFLRFRDLAAWNDWSIPWKERGTEQAAEIIVWGIGEGEISPLLPLPIDDDDDLLAAYVMLTGRAPINPAI
ncbi:MAG: hypothetical protein ABI595_13000 [Actinomycetota bacterium]